MEYKKQPLWDFMIEQTKAIEEFIEANKTNALLVKHGKRALKLNKRALHALGWRKQYHTTGVIPVSIPKQDKTPTEQSADQKGPKYAGRLTPQQGSDIKVLEMEGKGAAEISDLLMIEETKVVKYLKKVKTDRQPKNLIYTTNGKND